MKFAYSSAMFRLRPLPEAIATIAQNGFSAVELLADRPHAFPEDIKGAEVNVLNGSLRDNKITVSNLNSSVALTIGDAQHPSWIEEDWMEREKRIRYTLDCLRLGAVLGIGTVSTNGGGVIPASMHQGEAWRLLAANMHRTLPLAERLGVKLLLQPEPDMLLQTSHQLLKFVEELTPSHTVGINFNVVHLYCAGEDPVEAWDRVKAHVGHVELSDAPAAGNHRHLPLGEGEIDIPRFLAHLDTSGYDGYVTIAMEVQEHDPAGMVAASAAYLRNHGFGLEGAAG